MAYQINKQKCLGINRCGICLRNCPGATVEGIDGKAEIIDQEKLELCGGESVCPMGAIEAIGQEQNQSETENIRRKSTSQFIPSQGRGLGMGRGRGMGSGRGRGMGIGPRDGRGGGRGGGGRRG
jgi:NAD-dependent dihydropyrimidine dehydrogenase PreA subunit